LSLFPIQVIFTERKYIKRTEKSHILEHNKINNIDTGYTCSDAPVQNRFQFRPYTGSAVATADPGVHTYGARVGLDAGQEGGSGGG